MEYQSREYRKLHKAEDLQHFQVVVGETDLDIGIKKERYDADVKKKLELHICNLRRVIEEYIKKYPEFLTSLSPYNPTKDAPIQINEMCKAGQLAGVGPMACVAGLISEKTGQFLERYSKDVIVENGGDIWLKSSRKRTVSIFAGNSAFTNRVGIELRPEKTPLGICTSSGTVGHSFSFGKADAVVMLSPTAVLADAVATATCNIVQDVSDLEKSVDFALGIPGIIGAISIMGDKMAVRGEVKLISL
ncbi:MAG: UPF0280 family protein [Clostridia bacterium]|nr:UPF0280 family protein [Clostridia bacterium]